MSKRNLNIPGSGKSIRRKGSGGSAAGHYQHQSLSAAEEVSIANSSSLRMMMLQEESEFHLFRQQQTTAGKLQRAAKRERMIQLLSMGSSSGGGNNTSARPPPPPDKNGSGGSKLPKEKQRRYSEPDLMRCSVRIIPNAPNLSWEEYRRKRNEYIRSIFFRSAGNLLSSSWGNSGGDPATKGFSEYPILLLTTGDDPAAQQQQQLAGGNQSPVTPLVGRKLSMTVQSVDRFQAINARLSEKIQHLDKPRSNSTTSSLGSRRRPSSASLSAGHHHQTSTNGSNSLSTHQFQSQSQAKRRYSASPAIHIECCECAYLPLSQTVTLVKVQGPAAAAPAVENNGGRPGHWRACMVSGRDSLSCSLNSP